MLWERATRAQTPAGLHASATFARQKPRTAPAALSVAHAAPYFLELEKFVRAVRAKQRPVDGYYVTLWRLMLKYPELLSWEMLWTDSLRETYAAIYQKVKEVKPMLGVGWHIWHNNSFNPIYRAVSRSLN